MFIQYLFILTGILHFNGIFATSIVEGPSSEIRNLQMYDKLSKKYYPVFCANSQDLENSCIIAQRCEKYEATNVAVIGEFLFNGTYTQDKDWNWLSVYAADKLPVKTVGILQSRLMLKIDKRADLYTTSIKFDLAWETKHNDMGCLKIYNPMNKDKRVVIKTSCNDFFFDTYNMFRYAPSNVNE
ncbi:uncharacterized protein LOC122858487 [Aphidius gifuensis]|uniref:uncharacterized protein LOC122858487 n=1 Tax=Aphidius gifuensis TaxID=684658 RepID=UPI001CDB787C|nr:uncharacterized protein LOC122858487 [Aphidius gifuensis]